MKEEVMWSDEAWDKQVQVYKIQIKSVYQRTECKSGSTSPKSLGVRFKRRKREGKQLNGLHTGAGTEPLTRRCYSKPTA